MPKNNEDFEIIGVVPMEEMPLSVHETSREYKSRYEDLFVKSVS